MNRRQTIAERISQTNPTKIAWKKPPLSEEREELERTNKTLRLNTDLKKTATKGKLGPLSDQTWSILENTDSWRIKNLEEARRKAKQYGRDIDRVISGFQSGTQIPAPIVLLRKKGKPYLVSGNTRLMTARALKIRPEVWFITE